MPEMRRNKHFIYHKLKFILKMFRSVTIIIWDSDLFAKIKYCGPRFNEIDLQNSQRYSKV
jgi:hypothetical protein